jgi:hypothetical protein
VLELGKHATEDSLRAVERRLRERAVSAAAHRDMVIDVDPAVRAAAREEARDEERDVAEPLEQAEASAVVGLLGRLREQ